jgi:hypothetical protein
MKAHTHLSALIALSLGLSSVALAADSTGEPGRSADGKNPLKNVYFGEQHLHTANSPDAFAAGGRQSWDDAYRYALGEEVALNTT